MATRPNYIPWALGGLGLASLENSQIAPDLDPGLKTLNLALGAGTGLLAADPSHRMHALSTLPFKQLGLFGIASIDKLRKQQQSLVDANLGIAKIQHGTANIERDSAAGANRKALMFLIPALLGGAGLGYYAWNHRKKPQQPSRFSTLGEKGKRRSSQRIRIDVPPSAFPDDFLASLVNVDDNPQAYSRYMDKAASTWPGMLADWAKETTGIPAIGRVGQDASQAFAHLDSGDPNEADRYLAGTLGNTALAASTLNTTTLPLLGWMLKRPRLEAWKNTKGLLNPNQFTRFPTIGKLLYNRAYGNSMLPAQAARRQARGLSMTGAVDRARNIKYRYNPDRFAWKPPGALNSNPFGPQPKSPYISQTGNAIKNAPLNMGRSSILGPMFDKFLTAPKTVPRSWMGHVANTGRYGLNRGVNALYRGAMMARRNPNMSLFALGLPLSMMGVDKDKEQAAAAESKLKGLLPSWSQNRAPGGIPVSAGLSSFLGMFGGDSAKAPGLAGQVNLGVDPFSGGR